MTPPRGAGRRLSVDDWIQAGFAILADGGPSALRVDALCERLGVTKGSFYWHFTDLAAYRTALVEAWGSLQDQDRQRFENSSETDPRDRLRFMMQSVVRSAAFFGAGMGVLHGSDPADAPVELRERFLDFVLRP